MRLLHAISRLGITTIVIVHQPREQIFYLLDQVLLLSQGRTVYCGPTDQVQPYFERRGFSFPEKVNASDTVLDIVTGDGAVYAASTGTSTSVSALIEAWQTVGNHEQQDPPAYSAVNMDIRRLSKIDQDNRRGHETSLQQTARQRGAPWLRQVWHCFHRACVQQRRQLSSFLFEVGTAGLAGAIIGISAMHSNGSLFVGLYHPPFTLLSIGIDYKSTPQLALTSAMAIGFVASAPGFCVFGEERLMYFRESAAGHSRSAFYVGKVASTVFRIVLSSLHFAALLGVFATPMISFARLYPLVLLYIWCIVGALWDTHQTKCEC